MGGVWEPVQTVDIDPGIDVIDPTVTLQVTNKLEPGLGLTPTVGVPCPEET